jgi:hypothetical protein
MLTWRGTALALSPVPSLRSGEVIMDWIQTAVVPPVGDIEVSVGR